VADRLASIDGPPPEPGQRRISRRSLLASAGLVAGTAVATAAGFELARPLAGGNATRSAAPTALPARDIAVASPLPSAPAATPAATGGPTPTPPPPGPRLSFRSRTDLRPPALLIRTPSVATAPGLLLLTPNNGEAADGPTIYEETGELVWMHAGSGRHATNLQVIDYQGTPALCWWEGTVNGGIGDGDYVIVDAGYREVARITTDGGGADLHEFLVTPEGTALYFVDHPADPPPGSASPAPTRVLDCAVVEIDLASGRRLFEWHSVDHIAIDETVIDPPGEGDAAYDYVHLNSIDVDHDGRLLLSARNTSAVYKVDRSTGEIVWRLGGRRSDFAMGEGADFGWQHDVRRQVDGTITVFDDRKPPELGRGLVLALDEVAMTATAVRSYERPEGLEITSQGNMQILPNGNVLVGWGSQPVLTEFAKDGTIVFDASLPAGKQSYRDIRAEWSGQPSEPPALTLDPAVEVTATQHRINAYVSWNGATGVRAWRLLAGATPDAMAPVTETPRTGFETVITEVVAAGSAAYVAVEALDASGRVLGTSDPAAIL
jgi:Arylsulfotransferase (ASST)